MTQDQIDKATAIFARPAKSWSKEDDAFIFGLFKKGFRDELKRLRTQVLLNV
jgi:hypothetical protein